MRCWRRPAIVLLTLGALGAGVTASVAIVSQLLERSAPAEQLPKEWPVDVPEAWPEQPELAGRSSTWFADVAFFGVDTDYGTAAVAIRQYGWPRRAIRSVYVAEQDGGRIDIVQQSASIEVAGRGLVVEVKPSGFLLNTLFYAAIVALPLSFFPLRRRLRARRGRCPKCNYDLAGLDGPCPECGAAR
ncbi:MAG: hypothetical protein ACF8R7_04060 [Phycisphaerales bacterium JB039]